MSKWRMPYNVNTFGVAAAVASLKDPQHIKDEAARNNDSAKMTLAKTLLARNRLEQFELARHLPPVY